MESNSFDETASRSSRDNSLHLGTSQTSLKSTKSLDKSSSGGSLKREKVTIQFKDCPQETDNQKYPADSSLKVPHKIIANWRSACDKTKDKTKDLLKRWRTLPEIETEGVDKSSSDAEVQKENRNESGWSVHVWTTWVDRFSIDSDEEHIKEQPYILTPMQISKYSHFFTNLLDHDQDNLICEQDFEALIEVGVVKRLRHFADWSQHSTEFNILREVERGFISTFLAEISDDKHGFELNNVSYINKEGWLHKWAELLKGSKNLIDFPIWLQFFVKVLFQVINRGGTGVITRDELSNFYSSVLCLDTTKVGEILDIAYQAMTSNGDHPLHYRSFRLCFSNYLLGRYPNGSGHHILGAPPDEKSSTMFPIDYSALNAQPEDLEQYTPDQKSNRRSVIV
uniref:EF-hand domain-containing protein n=1 Tax=Dendroctonus ponderosae TaxID=77166 RepID=A0AAR5PHJ8_DENPD